jgi:hypothetical protein
VRCGSHGAVVASVREFFHSTNLTANVAIEWVGGGLAWHGGCGGGSSSRWDDEHHDATRGCGVCLDRSTGFCHRRRVNRACVLLSFRLRAAGVAWWLSSWCLAAVAIARRVVAGRMVVVVVVGLWIGSSRPLIGCQC